MRKAGRRLKNIDQWNMFIVFTRLRRMPPAPACRQAGKLAELHCVMLSATPVSFDTPSTSLRSVSGTQDDRRGVSKHETASDLFSQKSFSPDPMSLSFDKKEKSTPRNCDICNKNLRLSEARNNACECKDTAKYTNYAPEGRSVSLCWVQKPA